MKVGDLEKSGRTLEGAIARLEVLLALEGVTENIIRPVTRQHLTDVISQNFSGGELQDLAVLETPETLRSVRFTHSSSPYGYLFIGGCRDSSQGQAIWEAYKGGGPAQGTILGAGPDGTNSWYDACWATMQSRFQSSPSLASILQRPLIVCGHSAGGAIAWRAHNSSITSIFSVAVDRQICTFGMPKPGGPPLFGNAVLAKMATWFLSDDPVPFIPPPLTGFTRWWAGVSTAQAARLLTFTQPAGGVEVNLNNMVDATGEPSQVADPVTSIQSWLANVSGNVQTTHSIETYLARLNAAIPRVVDPLAVIMPIVPAQVPVVASRRQINARLEIYNQTTFARTNNISSSGIKLPKGEMFNVRRTNHVYYVYFGDIFVSTGPHKKGAHQLARIGNEFLRSIQGRAALDVDAFLNQFSNYLDAATSPTGDFTPVLINGA